MKLACLLLVLTLSAAAANLTGYISDEACGYINAKNTKEAAECARECVRGGSAPVFILDGDKASYKIADKSKVMALVGERVAITGTLHKDTVTIAQIKKIAK
jgi:hypothetical protein